MNMVITPITADAPVFQKIGCLSEKFVVDFANGIDVAHDHLNKVRRRTSFFNRMYDGFTGQGTRRQAAIQASLTDGLEASLQWLSELSESLAHSNFALTQVNHRVTLLTSKVAHLAHYSADTRQQLNMLASLLDKRMHGISQEIAHIGFIQKAQLSLDVAFDKWAAGRFAEISPAARCYATLEELRWSALGDYCRSNRGSHQSQQFMQMIVDRATAQLGHDAKTDLQTPVDMADIWLTIPKPIQSRSTKNDMQEALVYLADGITNDSTPFVSSTVQQLAQLPLHLPRIAKPRRVAVAMTREVFSQEAISV